MRGILTPSGDCSSAEPALSFPCRLRPKSGRRSPGLQRKNHVPDVASSNVWLCSLRPIARVAVAVAQLTCLIAAPIPVAASACAQTVARPPSIDRFANFIAEASARFTVPARWIRAIIQIESAGDEHAISSRGAMGLMQLMPGTWVEPLRVFGSLQLGNWALRASDRRGQDKARKVRAVGRGEEGSNFKHGQNIARYRAHLAMFGNAFWPLNFRHPMSPT